MVVTGLQHNPVVARLEVNSGKSTVTCVRDLRGRGEVTDHRESIGGCRRGDRRWLGGPRCGSVFFGFGDWREGRGSVAVGVAGSGSVLAVAGDGGGGEVGGRRGRRSDMSGEQCDFYERGVGDMRVDCGGERGNVGRGDRRWLGGPRCGSVFFGFGDWREGRGSVAVGVAGSGSVLAVAGDGGGGEVGGRRGRRSDMSGEQCDFYERGVGDMRVDCGGERGNVGRSDTLDWMILDRWI
uniref:Uncharacterized protein n=1 Tax=Oryza punctata TaxID=4537 RepID=A0A0E0JRW6_ORYPU